MTPEPRLNCRSSCSRSPKKRRNSGSSMNGCARLARALGGVDVDHRWHGALGRFAIRALRRRHVGGRFQHRVPATPAHVRRLAAFGLIHSGFRLATMNQSARPMVTVCANRSQRRRIEKEKNGSEQTVDRDELAKYLEQTLDINRFRDYCPNGLQVEGRGANRHAGHRRDRQPGVDRGGAAAEAPMRSWCIMAISGAAKMRA